jgi:hypothetical protein
LAWQVVENDGSKLFTCLPKYHQIRIGSEATSTERSRAKTKVVLVAISYCDLRAFVSLLYLGTIHRAAAASDAGFSHRMPHPLHGRFYGKPTFEANVGC